MKINKINLLIITIITITTMSFNIFSMAADQKKDVNRVIISIAEIYNLIDNADSLKAVENVLSRCHKFLTEVESIRFFQQYGFEIVKKEIIKNELTIESLFCIASKENLFNIAKAIIHSGIFDLFERAKLNKYYIIACHEFIFHENLDMIKLLISKGVDLNYVEEDNITLLIQAADHEDDIEILKLLLEKGSNVNYEPINGRTALRQAIYAENMEGVRLLINAGADINYESKDGCTPLIEAVSGEDNIEIVKLLIQKGADINYESHDDRWTVLMQAVYCKNINMAIFLIQEGAKVNHETKETWDSLLKTIPVQYRAIIEQLLAGRGAPATAA